MSAPVSIRLDDEVRKTLETEARSRNIGLATLLRQIAAEAARQVKRKRIREQTEAVGRYIASNPDAKEFAEFWGTPASGGLVSLGRVCTWPNCHRGLARRPSPGAEQASPGNCCRR
jgi:hypothetical protein